jgi:glycerophosphoryl diester phosphodiesterase
LSPAQKLVAGEGVLIVAHRGNSSVAPENTLPAFKEALAVGADLVELDYHHSADGVPVVLHDEILDRASDAEAILGKPGIVVGDVPLAELRKLDVGGWFDPKFVGTRISTLAEALDVIQAGSTTLIERKAGDAATLVRLLEEKNLTGKVVVIAFDWKFIADCRRLAPTIVLGALSGKPASDEQIRAAAATGADLVIWNQEKLGRPQIDLIHKLGKKAWVYTLDDRQRAKQFIAAGLDGIITNKPASMIEVRNGERGARSGK